MALLYQSIVISMFCFAAFQYILSRHNSSSMSVFFFATPLVGMFMGMLILKEAFDPGLLVGCVLVGAGIYVVNTRSRVS
jgi:O-acetylserine/cysteine efflux transporter